MSFNKKYIKPLADVKQELQQKGLSDFVNNYERADAYIGNAESIKFINATILKYYNDKKALSNTLDKPKTNKILDILTYPKRFIRKHIFKR